MSAYPRIHEPNDQDELEAIIIWNRLRKEDEEAKKIE